MDHGVCWDEKAVYRWVINFLPADDFRTSLLSGLALLEASLVAKIATMDKPLALADTFETLRPSIIAFASRIVSLPAGQRPLVPPIIGTGFFVDKRGIAVTNGHVIQALQKLPPIPGTGKPSAFALVFTKILETSEKHRIRTLYADIRGYKRLAKVETRGRNYAEQVPDFGFVTLNIRDVPAIPLASVPNLLRPGLDVATAGFPLGNEPLQFYGTVNQLMPILRRGIVSSVLPFDCRFPHGFTVDIMSQGGASGSPIFALDQPLAVGILHAGYKGTNFTYAIPSHIVAGGLPAAFNLDAFDTTGVPTLEEQTAIADREEEGTFGFEQL